MYMIDNMWFDALQQRFCKRYFSSVTSHMGDTVFCIIETMSYGMMWSDFKC